MFYPDDLPGCFRSSVKRIINESMGNLRDSFHSIITPLLCIILLGVALQAFTASRQLPHVSIEMEDPEFWIKKIDNPDRVLLTPEEIQKMNEENSKRQELYLCQVKDLKEEWDKEEIVTLFKEDWEGFGQTEEVRYGRYDRPLDEAFWTKLKRNLNQESLKERNRILFGLIVKRTDIRVFPTDELSMATPSHYEFDRFQHSSISPGIPIGIYHSSKDRLWAYVQTPFIRGWVRMSDLAIAQDKREVVEYEESKERLVMTGNVVHVFGSPSLQRTIFLAQMGTSFPALDLSQTRPAPSSDRGNTVQGLPGRSESEMTGPTYVIKVPFREIDGKLTFRRAYIPKDDDIHRGFLPYTQRNMARQAFKMLHQPYGWGEMFGGRDCSRFIMDLFATFGIVMPRNSKLQATIGVSLALVEGKTIKEKAEILDRAIPLATLLRLPGHIMLYLGKENGRYYAIHNIWGIQKRRWFRSSLEKIGRTVVSDLSLGRSGPNGSLLDRLTDIQFVGPEVVLQERRNSP